MDKSRFKLAFILIGLSFALSLAMWVGFDYLWETYPDQGIFKTLKAFAPLIAYLFVFTPALIIRNRKVKAGIE